MKSFGLIGFVLALAAVSANPAFADEYKKLSGELRNKDSEISKKKNEIAELKKEQAEYKNGKRNSEFEVGNCSLCSPAGATQSGTATSCTLSDFQTISEFKRMKDNDELLRRIGARQSCLLLYQKAKRDELSDSCLSDVLSSCRKIQILEKIAEITGTIKDREDELKPMVEEREALAIRVEEARGNRVGCAGCGGGGMRTPNTGDYILAGLQVATPLAGMYFGAQMGNSWNDANSANYQAYLAQCAAIGVPCNQPSMMSYPGMGFGFGMGMGMGGLPMNAGIGLGAIYGSLNGGCYPGCFTPCGNGGWGNGGFGNGGWGNGGPWGNGGFGNGGLYGGIYGPGFDNPFGGLNGGIYGGIYGPGFGNPFGGLNGGLYGDGGWGNGNPWGNPWGYDNGMSQYYAQLQYQQQMQAYLQYQQQMAYRAQMQQVAQYQLGLAQQQIMEAQWRYYQTLQQMQMYGYNPYYNNYGMSGGFGLGLNAGVGLNFGLNLGPFGGIGISAGAGVGSPYAMGGMGMSGGMGMGAGVGGGGMINTGGGAVF